jgi:uncharacterized membrane protein YgaE (UPF0421/DUF939 family)
MVEFVKNSFRKFFGFILWINIILCTIVGDFIGNSSAIAIVGIIIGLLIGLLINIVLGGFIATIISIDNNLDIMNKNFTNFVKYYYDNEDGEESE